MTSVLLIRADATPETGSGHVMRCFALAQAWRALGGRVVLASAALSAQLAVRWRDEGFDVMSLDAAPFSAEDVQATAEAARGCDARVVVLDGYGYRAPAQATLRQRGLVVAVLDDNLENAPFAADLVLNQNLHASASTYAPQDMARAKLLLGPAFALLRREFVRAPPQPRRAVPAQRVLVTLGGSDPRGLTPWLVDILGRVAWSGAIDVVVGSASAVAGAHPPRVTYHHDVREMVPLMQRADLAITAAGSTCWELARIGVPMLLVVVADNQAQVASSLEAAGVGRLLGRAETLRDGDVQKQAADLLDQPTARAAMSAAGLALVDGEGAQRVASQLRSLVANPSNLGAEPCR